MSRGRRNLWFSEKEGCEMLIAGRNGMMAKSSILPPGARWVEYLQSDGGQWIDTGVVPGGKIINAEVAFKQLRLNGTVSGIIGSNVNDGQDNFQFTCHQSQWRLKLNNYASYNGLADTNTHILKLNTDQGTFFDSRQLNTSQYTINTSNTRTVFLGACSYNGSPILSGDVYRLIGELYYAKIYDNGTLVRDFRPIAIGTTGYMLDLVTGEYLQYGNQGTGDFVIGPDISAPQLVGGGGG